MSDNESSPLTNQFVDKVTLELLMNKNHYNRYLSQTDPKKHQEHMDHLAKMKKYRNWIINTTTEFLDNHTHQVTTEVNEAFDVYVRTMIRHFEFKKLENEDEKPDEDMLFGDMDQHENNKEEEEEVSQPTKSFWGKNKVVKKSANFGYPMNYIPRMKDT